MESNAKDLICTLPKEVAEKVIAATDSKFTPIPTAEEFYGNMFAVFQQYGTEEGHYEADKLMCGLLRLLGYEKAVDYFEKQERWYG